MNTKKLINIFFFSSIIGLTLSGGTQAQSIQSDLALRCRLNETCPFPSHLGGLVYYNITPSTGRQYQCNINIHGGQALVGLTGGKNFIIQKGGGIYPVNHHFTTEISGYFVGHQDPNKEGQIKISNLIGVGSGYVTCYST